MLIVCAVFTQIFFSFLPFRENEHVVYTDRPLQVHEPSSQLHRRRGHIESVCIITNTNPFIKLKHSIRFEHIQYSVC